MSHTIPQFPTSFYVTCDEIRKYELSATQALTLGYLRLNSPVAESLQRLGERMRCSRKLMERNTKKLESLNLVYVDRSGNPLKGETNVYWALNAYGEKVETGQE